MYNELKKGTDAYEQGQARRKLYKQTLSELLELFGITESDYLITNKNYDLIRIENTFIKVQIKNVSRRDRFINFKKEVVCWLFVNCWRKDLNKQALNNLTQNYIHLDPSIIIVQSERK